jgi:GNAT superfamily N-acetyltransferase
MEPIYLGTEIDKAGSEVQIMRIDRINYAPVYTFFLRHMAELIEAGLNYPTTAWRDDENGAIFATIDGKVVGHIVYSSEHIKTRGALWITLSAVDKDFRGKGIYSLMHPYFEQRAREMGCWAIASHVHKNNHARLKSCEQVGMKQLFHYMGKKV